MQGSPATLIAQLEGDCPLPAGSNERFSGYGVMGLTFRAGHVLAMRRFVASSIGPSYTSVWHRDPQGAWIFYADVPGRNSCGRFYSTTAADQVETTIRLTWTAANRLLVTIPAIALDWRIELGETAATRLVNRLGRVLPERAWRSPAVLSAMAAVAGPLLGAGRVGLQGRVPNGQRFIANPRTLWVVTKSEAVLLGEKLGATGPLEPQARLGDFWIPQRGVFAIGQAEFEVAHPRELSHRALSSLDSSSWHAIPRRDVRPGHSESRCDQTR